MEFVPFALVAVFTTVASTDLKTKISPTLLLWVELVPPKTHILKSKPWYL